MLVGRTAGPLEAESSLEEWPGSSFMSFPLPPLGKHLVSAEPLKNILNDKVLKVREIVGWDLHKLSHPNPNFIFSLQIP